jgi:hypothetical protein
MSIPAGFEGGADAIRKSNIYKWASNPAPTIGETITITATIHNEGPAGAENVLVQFYNGDPSAGGVLIGETKITSIPAYGSSQASINWTIPTASSRIVFVKLDPSNTKDNLWRLGYNSTKRVA